MASVETKAAETEGETETRPSSFFSRSRLGGEYTAKRKETIVNQNVECLTYAVPHVSSIRLDMSILVQELCKSPDDSPGLSFLTSLMVSVDVKQY